MNIKYNKKQIYIASLTVVIIFSLTACGSATGSQATSALTSKSETTQSVQVRAEENQYLTRAEAMSLLYRTISPDSTPQVDADFDKAVGDTEYNLYAKEYKKEAYINVTDSSLDKSTYNSTMSRGEAIYLLMNRFYGEELDTYKADNVKLEDAKDKGEETGRTRIEELSEMLNNPEAGVEHSMYKAIALAYEKGILDTAKTRWNEGITKEELIELIIKVEAEFNKAGVIKGGLVDSDNIKGEDSEVEANIDGDDVEIPKETMDYLKNIEGKTIAEIEDKDKVVEKKAEVKKDNKKADNKNKKAKKKDKNKKVVDNNKVEQPKKDNNANGFNQGQHKKDNNVKVEQPVKKDQPVNNNNNKQKPVKKDNTKKDSNKNKNKGGQNKGGGFKLADPNSKKQKSANTDGNLTGDMPVEDLLDALDN